MKYEVRDTKNWDSLVTEGNLELQFQDGEFYTVLSVSSQNTVHIVNIVIKPEDLQLMIERWFKYTI